MDKHHQNTPPSLSIITLNQFFTMFIVIIFALLPGNLIKFRCVEACCFSIFSHQLPCIIISLTYRMRFINGLQHQKSSPFVFFSFFSWSVQPIYFECIVEPFLYYLLFVLILSIWRGRTQNIVSISSSRISF
jgi:hypothetical protein